MKGKWLDTHYVETCVLGDLVCAWLAEWEARHPQHDDHNLNRSWSLGRGRETSPLTGLQALYAGAPALDQMTIYRIRYKKQRWTPLVVADALLCAMDATHHLHIDLVPITRAEMLAHVYKKAA